MITGRNLHTYSKGELDPETEVTFILEISSSAFETQILEIGRPKVGMNVLIFAIC